MKRKRRQPGTYLTILYAIFGEANTVDTPLSPDEVVIMETALKSLTEREEMVVRKRFLEGLFLREIGSSIRNDSNPDVFGVTANRVDQLLATALRKLRHPSRGRQIKAILDVRFKEDFNTTEQS